MPSKSSLCSVARLYKGKKIGSYRAWRITVPGQPHRTTIPKRAGYHSPVHRWCSLSLTDTVYARLPDGSRKSFRRTWNLAFLVALWFAHQFNSQRVVRVLMTKLGVKGTPGLIHKNLRYFMLNPKVWPEVKKFMKGRFDIDIDELVARQKAIVQLALSRSQEIVGGVAPQYLTLAERANMNLLKLATDMDDRAVTRSDMNRAREEMLAEIRRGAVGDNALLPTQ